LAALVDRGEDAVLSLWDAMREWHHLAALLLRVYQTTRGRGSAAKAVRLNFSHRLPYGTMKRKLVSNLSVGNMDSSVASTGAVRPAIACLQDVAAAATGKSPRQGLEANLSGSKRKQIPIVIENPNHCHNKEPYLNVICWISVMNITMASNTGSPCIFGNFHTGEIKEIIPVLMA
jgi:hypothetical protein